MRIAGAWQLVFDASLRDLRRCSSRRVRSRRGAEVTRTGYEPSSSRPASKKRHCFELGVALGEIASVRRSLQATEVGGELASLKVDVHDVATVSTAPDLQSNRGEPDVDLSILSERDGARPAVSDFVGTPTAYDGMIDAIAETRQIVRDVAHALSCLSATCAARLGHLSTRLSLPTSKRES